MVKQIHKRDCISIALATIVLISLYAGCASPLVNAAGGDSATNVRASALVGTTVTSAPAACAQNANSLDVFAKGTDGALSYTHWDGTAWSSWQTLGGVLTSSPAATSPGNGLIDAFVRGTDNALWERTTTNGGSTWSSWYKIGGQLASGTGPAVCSQSTSSLDAFVQGTDHVLYYTHWNGATWSAWKSLGGALTSSPAATSPANGVIDAFVRGTDNALWERTTTNGGSTWSSWYKIGGQLASGTGPGACSWGSGRLDVFVQGTDGQLWHRWYTGTSWSGWESLGGKLTSSPAATSPGNGLIDVFVRGTDNAVWQKTYNGVWSSWKSVNGVSQTATPAIFYVPQAGSTWVNQGTAGASYNAYDSTPSLFQTQSNGYPYWGDIGKNDFIYIPAGSATNNQNVASWEIGFHFAGITSQRYQKIWDKACGGFFFEIDTLNGASQSYLTIYRVTTGGSGARWYIPTDTVLRTGHNYYIQIAWNTSAGPGHEPYPTIWIGEDGKAPVHQTHWDESGNALGGTGSWYNDAVGGANLGNTASNAGSNASAKTAWLDGGFFVYRQYNSIVDFSSGGSWNTDVPRWT
jgi:hypothetical protein